MTEETNDTIETKKPTYLVKLIRSETGRRAYPVKVGAAFTTEKGNLRIHWDILPASSEFRNCITILVPYEPEKNEA